MTNEIDRLRADLAAANARMSKLDFERTAAELRAEAAEARERVLAELLREARKFLGRIDPNDTFTLLARVDAAFAKDS